MEKVLKGAAKLAAQQKAISTVKSAIRSGVLVRPSVCEHCQEEKEPIYGHHYLGYAPEHRLHVEWLCAPCHKDAHIESPRVPPWSRKVYQ
jgi:hypothetical protein